MVGSSVVKRRNGELAGERIDQRWMVGWREERAGAALLVRSCISFVFAFRSRSAWHAERGKNSDLILPSLVSSPLFRENSSTRTMHIRLWIPAP